MSLNNLIDDRPHYRKPSQPPLSRQVIASGFEPLDQLLAGGFPLGALTELLVDRDSHSAMRLLIHSLASLSQQGRWIALITPPYPLHGPTLASHGVDLSRILLVHPQTHRARLSVTEQALRSGTCSAVLAWPGQIDEHQLRRLQLAAEQGNTLAVLLHPQQHDKRSLATLRIKVRPTRQGAQLDILKRRSGWPCDPIQLCWNPPSPGDQTASPH
ncbi:MAG: translesion DNA synthesis-associated protein ImuA [Gammaproteobacteria bacterium]|nr:translesion DNA synthesis-associated protein ImuA [Gammaproteobacteria bacterium]